MRALLANSLLARYAESVVRLVERLHHDLRGDEQMAKAVGLVDGWLRRWGLALSAEEIEAAIDASWAIYKSSGVSLVYKPEGEVGSAR